jgi:hypothetical protein
MGVRAVRGRIFVNRVTLVTLLSSSSAADFGFRFFLGFSSLIVLSYGLNLAAKLRKEIGTYKYLRHEFSSQRKTVN